MARWAIKLSEFGIQFKPCLALKGHVLADFLAEISQQEMEPDSSDWWTLNVDGASLRTGAGLVLQLKALIGEVIEQAIRFNFPASNNEAEYEAIIAGLDLAFSVSSENIIIRIDSQLVVGHVNGEYKTRDQCMTKYVSLINLRLGSLLAWRLEHVPRTSYEKVDALVVVPGSLPIKEIVLIPVYYQLESSITTNRVNEIDETGPSWMTLVARYLSLRELLDNRAEAHKIQVQATRLSLINDQLYKWSLGGPYLKCITQQQGHHILAELHDGICRNHPGGRTLAHRAHTQGYYWPTMWVDVATYFRKCDRCQQQVPVSKLPAQDLTTITSP